MNCVFRLQLALLSCQALKLKLLERLHTAIFQAVLVLARIGQTFLNLSIWFCSKFVYSLAYRCLELWWRCRFSSEQVHWVLFNKTCFHWYTLFYETFPVQHESNDIFLSRTFVRLHGKGSKKGGPYTPSQKTFAYIQIHQMLPFECRMLRKWEIVCLA